MTQNAPLKKTKKKQMFTLQEVPKHLSGTCTFHMDGWTPFDKVTVCFRSSDKTSPSLPLLTLRLIDTSEGLKPCQKKRIFKRVGLVII